MSPQTHTPPPKGAKHKQRQPKPDKGNLRVQERQLEPYFDDSIAGFELESAIDNKRKGKSKPSYKKSQHPSPNKHKSGPQPGPLPATQSAERGYHSESGTAHYIANSRGRSDSGPDLNQHQHGGVESGNGYTIPHEIKQSSATPTKQVYAGPNFLASPAASSLPMPKAFAKNLPSISSPSQRESPLAQGSQVESTPLEGNENRPKFLGRESSPLDFLFYADKAEKLRKASNSASPLSASRGQTYASPPVQRGSHGHALTTATSPTSSHKNRANKEKLFQEVDGTDEQSDTADSEENVDAIPYRQRLDALRNNSDSSKPSPFPREQKHRAHDASTQALKQLLFNSGAHQAGPPEMIDSPFPEKPHKAVSVDMQGSSPRSYPSLSSPFRYDTGSMPSQQPRPVPVRPSPNNQRSATGIEGAPHSDIKMMEDNLRKVLNIGT